MKRLLELAVPLMDLALGFLFGDTIAFLDFSSQDFLVALYLLQVVISELAPLVLDLAFELFPITYDLIPINESSP